MSSLLDLFLKHISTLTKVDGSPKSTGDLITEATGGRNLVDGHPTWELAHIKKHDCECMKKCCEAELRKMATADIVAAPYYFERVAILARKAKAYDVEIEYCETYIRLIEAFYARHETSRIADARKGPTYQAIVARLPKAKKLQSAVSRNT